MRESAIERAICQHAKDVGILQFKFTSPNRAGVADRIFLFPDRKVIFMEMKTPKGRLSRLQENEIRIMHKYGHSVYVVDSVEQGKEILESHL